MNKVISGKMYDTKTAKRVKVFVEIESETGYLYKGEILYKKSNGEYFKQMVDNTHGEEHDKNYQHLWNYLEPLTLEEAKEWMEDYASGDEYIKEFG